MTLEQINTIIKLGNPNGRRVAVNQRGDGTFAITDPNGWCICPGTHAMPGLSFDELVRRIEDGEHLVIRQNDQPRHVLRSYRVVAFRDGASGKQVWL